LIILCIYIYIIMNISNLIQYIIVFFFGLAIAYLNNYKEPTKNELLLIWKNKCYHIHHWITYSIFIAALYSHLFLNIKYVHVITIFLIGLVAEDLFYRDILKIREQCSKSFTLTSNVYDKK
jgi:uncharacterized membrane protein